jgi:HEXXH motif-containing protein
MVRNDAYTPTDIDDGPNPKPLLLPEAAFHELATGNGSPAVIGLLQKGEWCRRLVMLRASHDIATNSDSFGRVGPFTDAWQALERAQENAPDAVAPILMHPQVGAWLAYTLRRHLGGAASTAPLWLDFGQFNALALVAAAAAGRTFTTRVPLRDGRVMLPRLGMAYFAGCPDWDIAEAGTENGRIWLRHGNRQVDVPSTPGEDADGWWALRQLQVETDGLRLTVWLDDLDPLRDLADPVPPARLPETDVRRWANLLAEAWAILVTHHRPVAEALAAGVTSLVPLPIGGGWDTRSASTGDAFGAIMCSPPPDATTLAVSLAHEFMHIKLGGLMHLIPLSDGPDEPVLYAPWRDDPRPLAGFLQGVYAFAGITAFWRRQRLVSASTIDDFEYAYARSQTIEALDNAKRAHGLTEHGRRFVELLSDEVTGWSDDVVDDEAARLARLVTDGHRAGWRIRNCRPAHADIDALVAAWTTQSSGPVRVGPSVVLPDPEMRHWSQGRVALARRRIVAPDRYAQARGERWGSTLSDADLSLFAGDPVAAVKVLVDQIVQDPESADAWSGLVVALASTGPHPANAVLANRPEIVMAVYRAVPDRRVAPVDLATWIGRVIG